MRLTASAVALAFVATMPALAQTPGSASAAPPAEPVLDAGNAGLPPAPRDRFEGFNRAMWGLNQGLDRIVIRPVTVVYRTVTPVPARRGLSKVFANLNEPWSMVNNLLQGKVGRAFNNLGRFVVNTTIGVGGLADHATDLGLKPTPEDFGQTLAVWGVKSSAYLVLPLFGPSTVRDGIGTGVATVADPYNICLRQCTNLSWTQRTGIQAAELVSIRSDLIDSGADAFLKTSLDPYAAARSAYLQNRAAAIADADPDATGSATPGELDPAAADTPSANAAVPVPTGDAPAAAPAPVSPADAAPPEATNPPKLSFSVGNVGG